MANNAANIKHSAASQEWYTPPEFIEAVHDVMGGIDVDPASSDDANCRVRASRFFTKDNDGLAQPWPGRVFLNPPTGLVKKFWVKLTQEVAAGRTQEFIYLGYSLEQLQTLQNAEGAEFFPQDHSLSLCFPRKRIKFIKPGQAVSRPTHANFFVYRGEAPHVFHQVFSRFGATI